MSGLDSCSYRELQARCKQLKIRAIGQKEVLIQRIKDHIDRNSTSSGKNYLNVFVELSKDILNASFDKFTERNKFYITFALITTLCLVANEMGIYWKHIGSFFHSTLLRTRTP